MLNSILSFIFVLGILIFVHELGHFLTAKMVGIRVERFSLGFPPRMIGKKLGDTDYCISWLPLGGYVKMAGMVDESMDTTITGAPWEFQSKPIWQRIIVISAGSFMNILTAVVIYALVFYFTGVVNTKVGEVLPGKPAEALGLQTGDLIVSVNQQPVDSWEELTKIIHSHPGQEMVIEWQRDGQTFSGRVVPELQPEENIGLIGIGPAMEYRRVSLGESVGYGVVTSYRTLSLILRSLKLIVTGEVPIKQAIGGPLTIFQMTSESAKRGPTTLFMFMAFISLNLGFLNLLPFPVLDGGHLVFLLIEGVRRKPLSVKTRLVIQQVGMAFLLALMVFVIFNDIRRWGEIKEIFNF